MLVCTFINSNYVSHRQKIYASREWTLVVSWKLPAFLFIKILYIKYIACCTFNELMDILLSYDRKILKISTGDYPLGYFIKCSESQNFTSSNVWTYNQIQYLKVIFICYINSQRSPRWFNGRGRANQAMRRVECTIPHWYALPCLCFALPAVIRQRIEIEQGTTDSI